MMPLPLPPLPTLPALPLPPLPTLPAMRPLLQALGSVALRPLFFVWELRDKDPSGKYLTKLPLLAHSGDSPHAAYARGALVPAAQALASMPASSANVTYALGLYIAAAEGIWVLDVDGDDWRVPGSHAAQARDFAIKTGAFWEVSSSGAGCHVFAQGMVPDTLRKKWSTPAGVGIELYRDGRAMCLGLSGFALGSMDTRTIPPLWAMRARDASEDVQIGEGPVPWYGYTGDDAALIERIASDTRQRLEARMGMATGVTPAQLWAGDRAAISAHWEDAARKDGRCSEADLALANILARATGGDAARVTRLMWQSGLVRELWHTNRGKVARAVRKACAWVWGGEPKVWGDTRMAQAPALPPLPAPAPQGLDALRGMDGAREAIRTAGTVEELVEQVAPRIGGMGLDRVQLDMLANEIKRRADHLNTKLAITSCRQMLRPAVPGGCGAPEWLQDWAYLAMPDAFYHRPSGMVMKRAGAEAMMRQEQLPPGPTGKPMSPMELFFDVWKGPVCIDTLYAPDEDLIFESYGGRYCNSFNPDTVPDTVPVSAGAAQIEMIQRHIWDMCNHNEGTFKLLMGWVANAVLRPGQKIRWAPIIQGKQGTGKSFLGAVIRKAMGDVIPAQGTPRLAGHVKVVLPSDLTNSGGFTDWANGRAITIFEEIYIQGGQKWALSNIVKPYVSEPIVTINRKGQAGTGDIPNRTNYLAFTNHRDAVPLERGERRWFVIFATMLDRLLDADRDARNDVYFPALWRAFHSVDAGELRGWLQGWLIDLPPVAPMTADKEVMMEEGESPLVELLTEKLAGKKVVAFEDIEAMAMIAGMKCKKSEIKHALHHIGLQRWHGGADRGRTRRTDTGPKITLYTVSELVDCEKAKPLLELLD